MDEWENFSGKGAGIFDAQRYTQEETEADPNLGDFCKTEPTLKAPKKRLSGAERILNLHSALAAMQLKACHEPSLTGC